MCRWDAVGDLSAIELFKRLCETTALSWDTHTVFPHRHFQAGFHPTSVSPALLTPVQFWSQTSSTLGEADIFRCVQRDWAKHSLLRSLNIIPQRCRWLMVRVGFNLISILVMCCMLRGQQSHRLDVGGASGVSQVSQSTLSS